MTNTFAIEKHIVRETDKAILVTCYDIRSGAHDVWFPKSQIEIGISFIFMPEWLGKAKARDCRKTLGPTNYEVAREIETEKLAA